MRFAATLCLLPITASACFGAEVIYLSNYLGVPSGGAAVSPNPPYTTIPATTPYGFGVDCPGTFSPGSIIFQDFGPFPKGIGQHPPAEGPARIDFNLNAIRVNSTRDLAVFSARVGIDFPTSIQNNGGVFTVLVDGVAREQVSINGRFSASQQIFVSVVGAGTLSLITEHTGNYNSNHMCWGDASVSLIGGPCPADLNGDRLVDDSDFAIFVVAYNVLDCADPSMPVDCPADLNRDSLVDDADFSIFVVAYNDLLCP